MNVKGIVYLTGKTTIIAAFGEERWNTFHAKLAAKDKYFSQTIMNITLIPLDKFIIFLDDVLKEFFNNDKMHYWKLGEKSAEFSLSQGGPYHSYLLTKDIKQLIESAMPKIWSTYFDGGVFTAKFVNNVVHIKVTGVDVKNFYFEELIMGYNQQALKLFGKKSVVKRVRSLSSGDDDIYFQVELKDS